MIGVVGRDLAPVRRQSVIGLPLGHQYDQGGADHVLLHQMAAFNSPVWVNVGRHPVGTPKMRASASFILSVEDSMESILEWKTKERMIFRGPMEAPSRAAKMVLLDVDHLDIRKFIWCEAEEEGDVAALRDAGQPRGAAR